MADMGDCSKYRILQMAVIRNDDFLTSAFISLWGSCASSRHSILRLGEAIPPPRIVIPSVAEGSLLQSSSSPALLIRLHETPYPTFLAYQASRFRSHAYSISP